MSPTRSRSCSAPSSSTARTPTRARRPGTPTDFSRLSARSGKRVEISRDVAGLGLADAHVGHGVTGVEVLGRAHPALEVLGRVGPAAGEVGALAQALQRGPDR